GYYVIEFVFAKGRDVEVEIHRCRAHQGEYSRRHARQSAQRNKTGGSLHQRADFAQGFQMLVSFVHYHKLIFKSTLKNKVMNNNSSMQIFLRFIFWEYFGKFFLTQRRKVLNFPCSHQPLLRLPLSKTY